MTGRLRRELAAAVLVTTCCLSAASCTSSSTTPTAASVVAGTTTSAPLSAPASVPVSAAASTSAPISFSPRLAVSSTAPQPSVAAATVPTVVSSASTDTPQGAAVAWLTALRTASFRDTSTAWVQKVAPYVTPALAASYRKVTANGKGGGADWTTFVQQQCVSVVVNAAGIIPAEAPTSAVSAHVQVSATLTTACRAGNPATREFIAATVLVTNQHGRWAVAKREF